MARKYIDCRDYLREPEKGCSVALSAESEEELIEAAAQHGITVHHHPDSPAYRDQIRKNIRVGRPHRFFMSRFR